jgi:hypothetical protein
MVQKKDRVQTVTLTEYRLNLSKMTKNDPKIMLPQMGRIRRIQNVVFCLFSGDGPVMVLFKCRILHLPQMERIGRIVYSPTDETDLTDILYNQKKD